MKHPREISKDCLVECLEDLQRVLWPENDEDCEWCSDTLSSISNVLHKYGLGPYENEEG